MARSTTGTRNSPSSSRIRGTSSNHAALAGIREFLHCRAILDSMNQGLLDAIRQHDTCTVANAIETFGVRMKNEGFTNWHVRALFPNLAPIAGYAVTAKV